jgi:hypothetical protein
MQISRSDSPQQGLKRQLESRPPRLVGRGRRGSRAEASRGQAVTSGSAIVYSLVALALVLRLAYYLIDPTLSTDEAQLALNLRHRSYSGLVEPLDFNQAAPIGFLFAQKLVIGAVGGSEYALRLFPLLSALAASLIFYPVATKFVGRSASRFALALFVVSELLLVYGATTKQYSSDVAVTVALYGTALWVTGTWLRRQIVILALVGAIAVWFSHPAIFVEAGISSVLILESLLGRRWRRVLNLVLVSAVWLMSFASFYLFTHASYTYLQQSFVGNAAVLGSTDTWDGESRAKVYGGIVRALFGIPHFGFVLRNSLSLIAILLCVTGFIALLMRQRTRALLLIAPALFALLASALGRYPLFTRTLVFLIPALVITLAYGLQFLTQHAPVRWMKIAAGVGFSAVLIAAAVTPANHLRQQEGTELKQAMRHIADNQRPGDSLYVYAAAQYDLRYYLECGCFASRPTVRRARALWPLHPAPGGLDQSSPTMRSVLPWLVVGNSTSDVPSEYEPDFTHLLGRRRVWILIAAGRPESRRALISFLDDVGTRKESFHTNDDIAAAELYDLSGKVAAGGASVTSPRPTSFWKTSRITWLHESHGPEISLGETGASPRFAMSLAWSRPKALPAA